MLNITQQTVCAHSLDANVVVAWDSNYRTRINKPRILGVTDDGSQVLLAGNQQLTVRLNCSIDQMFLQTFTRTGEFVRHLYPVSRVKEAPQQLPFGTLILRLTILPSTEIVCS